MNATPPRLRAFAFPGGRLLPLLTAGALALSMLAAVPAVSRSVALGADPIVAAAGDIACDPTDSSLNGGTGTPTRCQELATSNLLVGKGYSAVLSLGDNQYYCGSLTAFNQVYDPSWGRVKSITRPVPGNHEYLTSGGTGCNSSNLNGAGYFNYFGSLAGTAGQGWYSYDVGAWHLIALNSNCSNVGGCGPTSPQGKWLAADLANHRNQCLLAYWHIPLFSSGGRAASNSQSFWNQLYAAHADLILNGHDHIYERFAPQTPMGAPDPTMGIRQITVGTGGNNHTSIATIAANSVVRNSTSFGILKLTLHPASYAWNFVRATGSLSDGGTANCHNVTPAATPTPTATAVPTPTPSATATSTATSGGGTITVTPIADAYVDSSQPTVNFGTGTSLRIDGSPAVNTYLKFSVSGISGTVTSATLRLFANSAQSTGYVAHGVGDTTWGETTITASNAPPFGSTLGSSGPLAAGTWSSAGVTGAVTANGTYTFELTTTSATAASFSSRTGTNPPQLVITTGP